MRKTLWVILGALVVAVVAPAARANSYTYSFTGSCYFAGTSVSFTTNAPAVMGTEYTPNAGATDLYTAGTDYSTCPPPVPVSDEGSIEYLYFAPSPYAFSPCSSVCTVQLYIVTAEDSASGPTIAGTVVPGLGTFAEYFGNGTLTITESTTGVPEPSSFTFLLLGSGLLVMILAVWKRTSLVQQVG